MDVCSMPSCCSLQQDRLDLFLREDEVSRNHRFVAHHLERGPRSQSKTRRNGCAILGDFEVPPSQAVFVDITRLHLSGAPSQRSVNGLPTIGSCLCEERSTKA